jgi:peptide/nickel transport system permease protein
LLRGDLGTSFWQRARAGRPDRFPATLLLSVTAIAIVIVFGLAVGVVAAMFRGTALDWLVMAGVGLGQSVATFWLGLMLILIFAVFIPLFPPSGYGTPAQLVLPAVTLAAYYVAVTTRLTRSGMLSLSQDFIRTARPKGSEERHHSAAAATPSSITACWDCRSVSCWQAPWSRTVFAWPGVGALVLDAITRRDYPASGNVV